MAFEIQFLSDIHLEVERRGGGVDYLYEYDFPACAANLALIGDIGWTRQEVAPIQILEGVMGHRP